MKHGEIILKDGRYFRVLKVGEITRIGDWLEWPHEETPALDYHLGHQGVAKVSECDGCLKLREVNVLTGAMMMALWNKEQQEKALEGVNHE